MDTVDLNIPLISNNPRELINAARALRAAGFESSTSRLVRRTTGERLLVVRGEYAALPGVNGAVRGLARALNAEPISAQYRDRPARFFCEDCGDTRDGLIAPAFIAWESLPAALEGEVVV